MIIKRYKREFIIGVSVIIAMLVLFFGINYLKGINLFKAANYYYASYTNVDGLAESAPVTINGFKVGLVREIRYEYDNPGHVLVEMSLDRALKVPEGSKAILSKDLLGTASIQLQLADNANLHKVGDKLASEQDPGLLAGVTGGIMPTIESILPKIDTLITSINRVVGDSALLSSVRRLDDITADLQATTRNLAKVSSSLSPIMTDVKSITGNASTVTADFTEVSAKLKEMPIDAIMADLQTTTNNLKALSQQLNDPNSSLGLLMRDPTLYKNINTTIASLDSIFVDVKRNPKRYINIKVF